MKFLIALCLLFTGCVHTEFELPNNGGKLSRTSVLTNHNIGELDVRTAGPNPGVKLKGYGSDQTTAAADALALAASILKGQP
jgi:hypothetical protein